MVNKIYNALENSQGIENLINSQRVFRQANNKISNTSQVGENAS